MKAQYGILRFAKYKGPEIGHIEAHNERTKENYASNPDVDTSRSRLNFHLVTPQRKYRAEAEKQIAEAGCRTRSDSVRVVEALITASPEFFKGKKPAEVKAYFTHAMAFIEKHQNPNTIISAVVHIDEKTPHMHLCFIPLTEDGRLSAKEIVGNKKKLTWWQDEFWKHMVRKYPELERGESASETGRDHIPPRIFKAMTRLTKQRHAIEATLESINPFNGKAKAQEISKMLDVYIPAVEQMQTELKKYDAAFAQEEALKQENQALKAKVDEKKRKGLEEQLREAKLEHDYREAMDLIQRIPPDILEEYRHPDRRNREVRHSLER
jgi:hypothetical protein